ncbi:EamA family transporter [Actinoallomurus vinaceus]|uniref:EamA family transporter n=1 Tax=Actinoallomurus vinaceus TaxID=1080074 RepID=UPI0031F1A882
MYLFATRQPLVALASVLASLYPAIVVLLSVVLLRERPARTQAAGLGLAAVALVCRTLA